MRRKGIVSTAALLFILAIGIASLHAAARNIKVETASTKIKITEYEITGGVISISGSYDFTQAQLEEGSNLPSGSNEFYVRVTTYNMRYHIISTKDQPLSGLEGNFNVTIEDDPSIIMVRLSNGRFHRPFSRY